MLNIFLSEANTSLLISGFLVLAGVAAAPAIAFFSSFYERNHKQKRIDRANRKPTLDLALSSMMEIVQHLNFLYRSCNGKTYPEVGEQYDYNFPKNILSKLGEHNDTLSKIVLNGLTTIPKKILDELADFNSRSEYLVEYFNKQIVQFENKIDLSELDKNVDKMTKSYLKSLKKTRKYLGVK